MNIKLKIAVALLAGVAFSANATTYSATATGTIKAFSFHGGGTSALADLLGVYPQVGQRFVETVSITIPDKLVGEPAWGGDGTVAFYSSQYANVSVSFTINGVTQAFSSTSEDAFIRYYHSPSLGDSYQIGAELYGSQYNRWSVGMRMNAHGGKHMWDSVDPSKNYVFNSSQAGGELSLGVRDFDFNNGYVNGAIDTIAISAVPEPGTYGMMLAGFALLGVVARRNKKAA